MLGGFLVAFSLYSAIPVPRTEWTKTNMRYALAFLPLVGVVVGAAEWGWLRLSQAWGVTGILYAVVAALLPMALTGGIHLDGFCDTCDAVCSFGDREKRLMILKDPHVGAFGVMYLAGLLLLQVGLFAELYAAPHAIYALALGYPLARAVGGSLVVTLPCAKESGLAHTFATASDRRSVRNVLMLTTAGLFALLFWNNPALGAAAFALFVVLLPLYRRFCIKTFGGVTGDLAGCAITCAETLFLLIAVVGGKWG